VSSIRSLATITLLAGVGIFLYLKINEVDPVLPSEVEGLQLGDIQFDDPSSQFGQQPSGPSAAPQFGTASAGNAAPAFSPSTVAAPPAQQAPAWSDSQASSAPSAMVPPPISTPVHAAPAPGESVGANNSVASAPELPPLPSFSPAATQTIDSAEMSAGASLPAEQAPLGQPDEAAATAQNLSVPPVFNESASQPASEFASTPVTPTTPEATTQGQASLFSATRLAVEAALDRGELSQALLLLSDWYDDPSLSATELQEVNGLLRQLAGSVIYSTEHRLEPPYMVQAGEQLEDIAQKYQVPGQLLAKINGISPGDQLQPGQQLKVVRGPFSALIDLGRRKMTLMLDRRYAGQFSIEIDPSSTVEEGHWAVNQKLLTPGNVGPAGSSVGGATEEQSLMLSRSDGSTNQLAILRGSNATSPAEPAGRVLRLRPQEVGDVYDILSLGSQVVIRR